MLCNASTLAATKIEPRIQVCLHDPECNYPTVRLGEGDFARYVRLGVRKQPDAAPIYRNGELIEAVPIKIHGTPHLIRRTNPLDLSHILRVQAAKLVFGYEPLLTGTYWPGGESPAGAWTKAGAAWNKKKDQLFVLFPGHFIFVIDTYGAVARVDYDHSLPQMAPAKREEFARYVAMYTIRKVRDRNKPVTGRHRDASWGANTLIRLGERGLATQIIDNWQTVCATSALASGLAPIVLE